MLDQPRKKVKGIPLKKDKKKAYQVDSNDGRIDENDHEADDEGDKGSNKNGKGKESDKDEEKDQVIPLNDRIEMRDGDGNIIHKKRRRKNVESRDVST